MKRISILGVAVAGVLALTALAGVAQAAATETTLCKGNEVGHTCSEANRYPKGTALEATSSSVKFKAKVGLATVNVTCTASTLKGETSAQIGNPLPATVSSWTLGECTAASKTVPCTVTTEHLPFAGSVAWSTKDDGSLSVADSGKGAPAWYFDCKTTMSCTYTAPVLSVEGGSPAQLVASEATMTSLGGTKCGKSPVLTATYSVSSPKPLYVANGSSPPASGSTVLCESGLSPCFDSYLEGTEIEAESSEVTIKSNLGGTTLSYTCTESTITGKTTAFGGEPLPLEIDSWSLAGCSSAGGTVSCTTQAVSLPYDALLKPTLESNGGLTIGNAGWQFICSGSFPDCEFSAAEADGLFEGGVLHTSLQGGNPGAIVLTSVQLDESAWNENGCYEASTLMSGKFTIKAPAPVYVSESA